MRIALVTGGFDPIHSGHIQLLREAGKLGDIVVVGLNSDDWLKRKKGAAFMSQGERMTIVRHLHMVHSTLSFDDRDDTACDAIALALKKWPDYIIRFCNGGDRIASNTPEFETYKDHPRVQFRWDVGGDKVQSSSDLLARWENRHAGK
jgi:cytidyltransferase-like protein